MSETLADSTLSVSAVYVLNVRKKIMRLCYCSLKEAVQIKKKGGGKGEISD